jgi:histone chaperone ASF1
MQAALEKELADTEAATGKAADNGDAEMGGTDNAQAQVKEVDEASDAGSEDLEDESSDDDDDEEDEEGEGEGDDDMEMADGEEKAAEAQKNGEKKPDQQAQQQPEVMVH